MSRFEIQTMTRMEGQIHHVDGKIQSSFLFGGNAPYVEEQYELYLADPASVRG
ncbi:hypothetical protein ACFFYR_02020 [Paraburkholderia dipogonis]|uniref:2-oxoglutarate dehydrogenase E1 subunit family protein n=1 Tax=Paraburkholderia dipogonis TaxID=1211383 RepID=UPI0035EA8E11